MDLRQLRYFIEIVEQGSITAAAAQLNVAQPALSLHVKNMEEHLGLPLLVRNRSGVQPTEAGDLLAQRARVLLNDYARIEDEVRHFRSEPSGTVRIGMSGTISGIVGLPLVHLVRDRFPGINLTIAEAMSGFLQDWLHEARLDIALLYDVADLPGLISETLLEEELAVVSPKGFDVPAEVTFAALEHVPLILPSATHGLRIQCDRLFRAAGVAPKLVLELDSFTNIKGLVAAGFGASILPLQAVSGTQAHSDIAVSRLTGKGAWRSVNLIMSSNRAETRAQVAVAGLLREVFGTLLASGEWTGGRRPGDGA